MSWTIAGNSVEPTPDIELTASTLSVAFEIDEADLSTWEALGDRAGDLAVETGFGGAFRTLARGTQGTITVNPAASESPPIATADWHIDGFNADPLGPERYEVSLDLQRPNNRRDEFAPSASAVTAADQGFGFNFGANFGVGDPELPLYLSLRSGEGLTVGVNQRQLGHVSRDGSPTGAAATATLFLSDEQAAAIVDAAGYPAGVVERAVPDGDSQRIDESDNRQTVGVDTRESVDLTDGDWLLTTWTLSWHSYVPERTWRVELTLTETSS